MIINKQYVKKTFREKVCIIGIITKKTNRNEELDLLEELKNLTETAGGEVVERFIQVREKLDIRYLIGKGKLEELKDICIIKKVNLVIFNRELSPSQQRNIQIFLDLPVIDRPALILDIFAKHAVTKEAIYQVELAQYTYQLPRLKNLWKHLEKQEGVIGTRGPGETQIETDRRLISKRITFLKKRLEKIKIQRSTSRAGRENIANIAIVGYTNSGKSTLLNTLTNAGVLVEDKLFATLATTSRKYILSTGQKVILTDTVGFIRRLPHLLIDAFKSTLEEILYADVILHILDITKENFEEYAEAVYDTLREIGVKNIPVITVLNKVDILENKLHLPIARRKLQNTVAISAFTGDNIEELIDKIIEILSIGEDIIDIKIPVEKYYNSRDLFENVKIINENFENSFVQVKIQGKRNVLEWIQNKI